MSREKQKITSASKAVGAAIVALSGFVPMPNLVSGLSGISALSRGHSRGAHAASLPIPVSGSALSGIALAGPVSLKFGSVVATNKTGTYGVKTDGGVLTGLAGAKTVGGKAQGKITTYTALVSAGIDIKISKIGKKTLTGAGATGKVTLNSVNFGSQLGGAALKLVAVGTVATKTNYAASVKNAAVVGVGGTLKWTGLATPPVGNIPGTMDIVITITY